MNKKHLLIMGVGCAAAFLGLYLAFSSQWRPLGLLFIFACPLMHLFMMRGMHGEGHQGHAHGSKAKEPSSDRRS